MITDVGFVCDKTAGALAALGRNDIFISDSTYFYDGRGCCYTSRWVNLCNAEY